MAKNENVLKSSPATNVLLPQMTKAGMVVLFIGYKQCRQLNARYVPLNVTVVTAAPSLTSNLLFLLVACSCGRQNRLLRKGTNPSTEEDSNRYMRHCIGHLL